MREDAPILMLSSGVLVIPLDPETYGSPSQALLIALTTAICSIEGEMAEQIEAEIALASAAQQAGDPRFGPYFAVARTAWAAFKEIKAEKALVQQQLGIGED